MVRCDFIDAMDRTQCLYRKNSAPFGGAKILNNVGSDTLKHLGIQSVVLGNRTVIL